MMLSAVIGLFSLQLFAQDQRVKEEIKMEISESELKMISTFGVKNINGDVKISGSDINNIVIRASKILRLKSDANSNEISEKVTLKKLVHNGKMFLLIDAPGVEYTFIDDQLNMRVNQDNEKYYFEFNIEISAPKSIRIEASTINSGDVFVEHFMNGIEAGNINGNVFLEEVEGEVKVRAINGNIKAVFKSTPFSNSDFMTVNGNIELFTPANLSAEVTFKSFRGELYTDYEQVTRLKQQLKNQAEGNGTRYRIDKSAPIKIGNGGNRIHIETMNGDAYLRKRNS